MATKEPVRRCVRCKTKKKGCSRGSPCERCAQAGLTAAECIYLESDTTFRSIAPRKKDKAPYTPKASAIKVARSLSNHGNESDAIARCSRCIRTARGCSHERPCEPCREHGLSEWECRYTSASSFKVRGPGARGLRKIQSMERMPILAPFTTSEHEIARIQKQARSHSTNSAPTVRAQAVIDQIPRDYRTPSPPTNISPISEPANWRDLESPETAVPEVAPAVLVPKDNDLLTVPLFSTRQIENRSMLSRDAASATALAPTMSQQSHANTIPESSPAIYTDDYHSSPSPFNSPQFQSSPPVQFQSVRPASFPNEAAGFSPQAQIVYRPPAGYAMQPPNARPIPTQTHLGFSLPQNQPQYQQMQQVMAYSQSPPQQIATGSFSSSPRHRAIPNPSPRYASPGPYSIPARNNSYQESRLSQQSPYQHQQAIPIRRKPSSQQHFGSYTSYGASPNDPSTPDSFPDFAGIMQQRPPPKEVVPNWGDASTAAPNINEPTHEEEVFEWQEGN